jgi:hypothetical protein
MTTPNPTLTQAMEALRELRGSFTIGQCLTPKQAELFDQIWHSLSLAIRGAGMNDKWAEFEKNLAERYRTCEATATPDSILLAVLNAVADVNRHWIPDHPSSDGNNALPEET